MEEKLPNQNYSANAKTQKIELLPFSLEVTIRVGYFRVMQVDIPVILYFVLLFEHYVFTLKTRILTNFQVDVLRINVFY